MNGTIIAPVKVYNENETLAMSANVGDKVVGIDGVGANVITKLTRNGVSKLPVGTYYLAFASAVQWDEVTPPDPQPTGKTLTHTIKVYSDGSIDVDGKPYI